MKIIALFSGLVLAAAIAAASPPAAAAPESRPATAPTLQIVGEEEVVFSTKGDGCPLRQFPDSPARAVREAEGSIVLFATFENNWYLRGADWKSLKADCLSAGHGARNADPRALDDKYWIQALSSTDGKNFVALGSHEYLGTRHGGNCRIRTGRTMEPACWYSSITQYVSLGSARHFARAAEAPVVATPQMAFDPQGTKRVGYFTTSNIVTDGAYRYVLIFAEGSETQRRGNCLFRAPVSPLVSAWKAWDGAAFSVDLSALPAATGDKPAACKPVAGLPHEVRGLVRHGPSGTWIAVYSGRVGARTGVVYSTSRDLLTWSAGSLLLDAPLTRRDPDCAAVYRYPSVIDQTAPGFTFETVGERAWLYGVKINLAACKPVSREIVRVPIAIVP